MSATRGRWSRFVDFCAVTEDATPLAITRIVLGATVALHLLRILATGETTTTLVHTSFGGLQEAASRSWASPSIALALTASTAAAAACVAVGLFTRPAVVLTWVGMRLVSQIASGAQGGTDALSIDLLVLLAWSGCGNTLSVDAWRQRRRMGTAADAPALRVVRLMVVVQLVMLYTLGGLQKVSYGWVPGGDASALWFALHQPQWTRFDGLPPGWSYPFTQMATTSAWLFEVMAPLMLVSVLGEIGDARGRIGRHLRRVEVRIAYLTFGFLMHVGIELLMEVGPYLYVTCSMYSCVLGPPLCRRLLRRTDPIGP